MQNLKSKKVIVFAVLSLIVVLLVFFSIKLTNYILPYKNVDAASKDFLSIEDIENYELIKHYTDTIQYHIFRAPVPIFLVDITYEQYTYEEKKEYELTNRNTNFEFEIDDFFGIVTSELKDGKTEAVCFCDKLRMIRYIVIYNDELVEFYDDIDSFENQLDVYLWGIGCKWETNRILNFNEQEDRPDNLLWERRGKAGDDSLS